MLIWDNFAVMHHRNPFKDTKRRVMLRTQIKGPAPSRHKTRHIHMTAIRAKSHVEIIPTGAALGAEVRVDDLRAIEEAAFKKIEQAWFDHSVLFIRNQQLGDPDLLEFAGRFGELELPARSRIGQPWIPNIHC